MVTGGSYGGYMTLAVATMYNDRIACAVDIVGISNFNTFLKNTESYRRDLRRVEYGDERVPEMRDFFEQHRAAEQRGEDHEAAVRVQGGNDPRVPRTEAEQMVAKVRENGSARVVPDGERRGPRLSQEAQRRLPVLRHGDVRAAVPAGTEQRADGVAVGDHSR